MTSEQHDQDLLSRLDVVEGMLEALLLEVRGLKKIASRPKPIVKESSSKAQSQQIEEGDRVKVLSSDCFHHRQGKVIGRRGKMHWNVMLDRTPRENMNHIIYRCDSNLQKLPTK